MILERDPAATDDRNANLCHGAESKQTASGWKVLAIEILQHRLRRRFDRGGQFRREKDLRVAAPTQNPTLDFPDAGQTQTQRQPPPRPPLPFLGRVPTLFPDAMIAGSG